MCIFSVLIGQFSALASIFLLHLTALRDGLLISRAPSNTVLKSQNVFYQLEFLQNAHNITTPVGNTGGWRGGAMVGRRTCDEEVASSIPGRARLRNDSGQVVHTQLPRR